MAQAGQIACTPCSVARMIVHTPHWQRGPASRIASTGGSSIVGPHDVSPRMIRILAVPGPVQRLQSLG